MTEENKDNSILKILKNFTAFLKADIKSSNFKTLKGLIIFLRCLLYIVLYSIFVYMVLSLNHDNFIDLHAMCISVGSFNINSADPVTDFTIFSFLDNTENLIFAGKIHLCLPKMLGLTVLTCYFFVLYIIFKTLSFSLLSPKRRRVYDILEICGLIIFLSYHDFITLIQYGRYGLIPFYLLGTIICTFYMWIIMLLRWVIFKLFAGRY